MSLFTGKFKLVMNDNFEEHLKVVGAPFPIRKLYLTSHPVIEITQEGDVFGIKTIAPYKTTEIKFKLGEEFDEESEYGQTCKSMITQEGDNTLVQTQDFGGKPCKITREFSDQQMKMTLEFAGVVCTRTFERVFTILELMEESGIDLNNM